MASDQEISAEQLARLLQMAQESEPAGPELSASSQGPFRIGETIDGFKIEAEISRGGMGVVYKAKEKALCRYVALKALGPHIAGDPSAAKRFRREAKVVAQLTHPNIVKIHYLDKREPPRYFTMEFVAGPSLREKVEAEGFLSPAQAVQIAVQACEALEYAHGTVLHRDIKPSNILLENNIERVRVTDFGIAQDLTGTSPESSLTRGLSPGTPPFMSPEQNRGEKLDARTDVFSLGVTLYYTLTGKLPFRAQNRVELAEAFRTQKPVPPSRFNPKISEELDRIVLKMIAVKPAKRYRSCTALLSDLRHLSKPDLHPSRWSRLSRVAFRVVKKTTVLAGLLLIVILLVWSVGLLVKDLRQSRLVSGPNRPADPSCVPYAVAVNSPVVTVFDRSGRSIWTVRVEGTVVKAELASMEPAKPTSLIVGVGGRSADTGTVLLYNAQGDLVWKKQTAEPYPYPDSGVNRMEIRDLLVADLWLDGYPHIVVVSADVEWRPSKVTILDRYGVTKRVYWHPGHLYQATVFKPSSGKRMRILAWGCNNDMRAARESTTRRPYFQGLVCLDPDTMSGEAPPRQGRIGKGVEEWYALLLPQGLTLERILLRPPQPGAPEGLPGQTLELQVSGERFLYLDESGKIVGRGGGDSASEIDVPQVELIR